MCGLAGYTLHGGQIFYNMQVPNHNQLSTEAWVQKDRQFMYYNAKASQWPARPSDHFWFHLFLSLMMGPNWTSWHSLTFKMFRCILNMENSFPNSILNLWENCPKQMCEIQQETRSAHIEGKNASNRTFWSMITYLTQVAKCKKQQMRWYERNPITAFRRKVAGNPAQINYCPTFVGCVKF